MASALLPIGIGLAFLALFGAVVTSDASITGYSQPGYQTQVLAVLFNALAPMMTPLSSATGRATLMPIAGEQLNLGFLPLAAWTGAAVLIGVSSRGNSLASAFVTASLAYLLWLVLGMAVLPQVNSSVPWPIYTAGMSDQLFFKAPLDFVAVYALPITLSMAVSRVVTSMTKPRVKEQTLHRRRFWEY